jgi:uncharacterized protein
MKVLLDTNVIVSAVTTRGLCADVFRAVLAGHELVTCARVLEEVEEILRAEFSVPENLVAEYLELIDRDAIAAEPPFPRDVRITEKDDLEIIRSAIGDNADILVTGDSEVQRSKSIQGLRFVSPRAFWEELTARHR